MGKAKKREVEAHKEESREELLARMAEGKREPNPKEARAIAAAREARKDRPARAAFSEHPDCSPGKLHLDSPHSDTEGQPYLVAETFSTTSDDFVTSTILQLSNVARRNRAASVEGLNASMAIVGAVAPANELEAALAAQMASTHDLSMEMLARAKRAETREAMRDYGNLATKLTRTFSAQLKTLSDWRRGGEQVVRHVHVYEGGQAVVAETVNLRGCKNEQIGNRGHEPIAALPSAHPSRDSVPVSSDEGEEALLPARGRSGVGRAERK